MYSNNQFRTKKCSFTIKTEDCGHGYTEAFKIAHERKMCLYCVLLSYFEKLAQYVGGLSVCIFVALSVRMCVAGANKVEVL